MQTGANEFMSENTMQRRPFGNTGMHVSPLTFGAWSIGGPAKLGDLPIGWSGVNDADSKRAVAAALDAGINVFDTADKYAEGHSERLLGEVLAQRRDEVVLVTKTGIVGADDKGIVVDFSPERIREACAASLRRLATDRIDIYLMHLVTDRTFPGDDTRGALEQLRGEGKIRAYGISVQFPRQGSRQLHEGFGEAMMLEYNPFKRGDAEAVLDAAHEKGVGVITRGALEKGLLSGKYAVGHEFDADDVRSRIPPGVRDGILEKVSRLQREFGFDRAALLGLALGFPLRHPGCSTVAAGMKTDAQVRELVEALRAEVPRAEEALELLAV